jgi:hypothetical protein
VQEGRCWGVVTARIRIQSHSFSAAAAAAEMLAPFAGSLKLWVLP